MIIYKILTHKEWTLWQGDGVFAGATIDLLDGYIHLSTQQQARETAARHFVAQNNLWLISLDSDQLGAALRWEPSRDGQLFPHHYGPLSYDLVQSAVALPWDGQQHIFPSHL
jgi:uncharacterized protein (DUF952 family)